MICLHNYISTTCTSLLDGVAATATATASPRTRVASYTLNRDFFVLRATGSVAIRKMISGDEINEVTQDVFKAIFVNDFDGLQKIYAKHELSTDILDEHGMTPLQHAAYKGNEQIVRWLLNRVSVTRRLLASSVSPSPYVLSLTLFRLFNFSYTGRRRQLGKTQIPVHRFAFCCSERQPRSVQFTIGSWCQKWIDQLCWPYCISNGCLCRFVLDQTSWIIT